MFMCKLNCPYSETSLPLPSPSPSLFHLPSTPFPPFHPFPPSVDEATDILLNINPCGLKDLLYHLLSGKEFRIDQLGEALGQTATVWDRATIHHFTYVHTYECMYVA